MNSSLRTSCLFFRFPFGVSVFLGIIQCSFRDFSKMIRKTIFKVYTKCTSVKWWSRQSQPKTFFFRYTFVTRDTFYTMSSIAYRYRGVCCHCDKIWNTGGVKDLHEITCAVFRAILTQMNKCSLFCRNFFSLFILVRVFVVLKWIFWTNSTLNRPTKNKTKWNGRKVL